MSGDGNTAGVDAYLKDGASRGFNGHQASVGEANSGVAYALKRTGGGGTWSQRAYLKSPNADADADADACDGLGTGISLSRDGSTLAVAAELEDSGAAGLQGNQADSGTFNAGAVCLY